MTDKQLALQVLDTLPKDSTWDDILEALFVLQERRIAEQAGSPISEEEAKERFRKWLEAPVWMK